MSSPHDAWSDFWARNSKPGGGGGCLPARWQGIEEAQRSAWAGFTRSLPKGVKVLDLATGDGRVMKWMLAQRRDLKLLGADMAPQLPDAPRGTKVKSGVLMENLPFPDNRFSAMVSQFGFEYGHTADAAKEAARVVNPEGKIGLMVHRQDGPILEHNLARRDQIKWVLEERNLPKLAKDSLRLRIGGLATVPTAIANAPEEGARLFGPQSAAWEISEAIKRCLVMGARDTPSNLGALIDTIVTTAGNELGRIASLEAACGQTADRSTFTGAIEAAGLKIVGESAVLEGATGRPFADFLTITHT